MTLGFSKETLGEEKSDKLSLNVSNPQISHLLNDKLEIMIHFIS